MSFSLISQAHAAAAPAAAAAPGNPFLTFLPLLILFGVFYFMLIRPQMKRQKEVRTMLGQLAKNDEVIAKGRAIEGLYPDYVESGNVYTFVADACLKKEDKACAIDELGRYSKIGGRDPETIKKYAKLLVEAGKKKEAETALERLNFIFPIDAELHERLGSLLLETGDAKGAVREYQALIAMHPIDVAGSHYNLAKAFKAAGQKDQAREEAVSALEAAPNYKPAQKLLLEVSE